MHTLRMTNYLHFRVVDEKVNIVPFIRCCLFCLKSDCATDIYIYNIQGQKIKGKGKKMNDKKKKKTYIFCVPNGTVRSLQNLSKLTQTN